MERRKFSYGRYSYDYFLTRQDRKTISLTVKPTLSVVLKCPLECSEERLDKFLRRKWRWLEKQLNYFRKFQGSCGCKEYISGESFLYLGRQYKFVVDKGSVEGARLEKGRIRLATLGKIGDGNHNKDILEGWYERRRNRVFAERYAEIIKKFDYEKVPDLAIRKMNRRWGSYLRGKKIFLNPRLIQASKECIDYVIAHELCHMQHGNHDRKFYELLESKIKNWKEVKEKLELRFI